VLEALCCGLPVITTRYNGASELISPPKEGLVIDDPHDPRSLADAIAVLLDPATRAACASSARQTARRWSFEQHYQQLMQFFRQAAGRKQAA
jgi:UDP-glucose:(heptosyl)LPS alpha-1,3-glucosyltransferase